MLIASHDTHVVPNILFQQFAEFNANEKAVPRTILIVIGSTLCVRRSRQAVLSIGVRLRQDVKHKFRRDYLT
jgi:hypothetical protein